LNDSYHRRRGWTLEQARRLYNIDRWSGGYFDIDESGCTIARLPPHRNGQASINLLALTKELQAIGHGLPVLVRFTHILHDRIDSLCEAFETAIAENSFQGRYTAVYPIKVNQQRSVVSEILNYGGPRVGLEAGSKPELMAVLALSKPKGMIICNGYKDREYIRLALIGRQLDLNVFLVAEKLSELDLIIDEAARLNVPQLGLRLRLASIGAGKWQNTGGEKSKFGLSAGQTLLAVERLRAEDLLDTLLLMHCHLGSQIANIRDIQRGLAEVGRYYSELYRLGVPLSYVDVGGGLGVDYEGTASRSDCSMNYSIQEYANNVIHSLCEVCTEQGLPHPDIITESGRALTAHHAVIITNVIDYEHTPDSFALPEPAAEEASILRNLWSVYQTVSRNSAVESYHDAAHWLSEAQGMYIHGVLSLEQRAHAEQLYYAICREVRLLPNPGTRAHRELLDELNDKLAEKFFLNFSLFQSAPDAWALDQIFPIMPLHRLDEHPTSRAILQDLTCDSDGRIQYYVGPEGVETTLPLPPYRTGESYLLGIFLVGAYQEILGDMHNLFGDTNAVNVELNAEGGYRLLEPEHGDTVAELLRYVHFKPEAMLAAYQAKIMAAKLSSAQCETYLAFLEAGLRGYTYLED
jgi:arginine decarboxylase